MKSDGSASQEILVAESLTLDFWASRQAFERFMAAHAAEYKRLDAAGEGLTLRERKIGWFERVTQARGEGEQEISEPDDGLTTFG